MIGSKRYITLKGLIACLLLFAMTAGMFLPLRKALAADVVTFQDNAVREVVLTFLNPPNPSGYSITQADLDSITNIFIDGKTITTFADFSHFANLENVILLNCTLPDLSRPENRFDFLNLSSLYNFQINWCSLGSIPDNYFKDYITRLENDAGSLSLSYNFLGGEWQKSWFDTSMSDQAFQDFLFACDVNGPQSNITLTPSSNLVAPDVFDNYTLAAENGDCWPVHLSALLEYADVLKYNDAERLQIINTLLAAKPRTIADMLNTNTYGLIDELVTGLSPIIRDNPATSNVTDMDTLKDALVLLMKDGIDISPLINNVLAEFVGGMLDEICDVLAQHTISQLDSVPLSSGFIKPVITDYIESIAWDMSPGNDFFSNIARQGIIAGLNQAVVLAIRNLEGDAGITAFDSVDTAMIKWINYMAGAPNPAITIQDATLGQFLMYLLVDNIKTANGQPLPANPNDTLSQWLMRIVQARGTGTETLNDSMLLALSLLFHTGEKGRNPFVYQATFYHPQAASYQAQRILINLDPNNPLGYSGIGSVSWMPVNNPTPNPFTYGSPSIRNIPGTTQWEIMLPADIVVNALEVTLTLTEAEVRARYDADTISNSGGIGALNKKTIYLLIDSNRLAGPPQQIPSPQTPSDNGPDLCTVTFIDGIGRIWSKQVYAGSLLSQPDAPIREGYTFTGWFKDEALTQPWDFANDRVNRSVTLYAGWTLNLEVPDEMVVSPPKTGGNPYAALGWACVLLAIAGAVAARRLHPHGKPIRK